LEQRIYYQVFFILTLFFLYINSEPIADTAYIYFQF